MLYTILFWRYQAFGKGKEIFSSRPPRDGLAPFVYTSAEVFHLFVINKGHHVATTRAGVFREGQKDTPLLILNGGLEED